MYLYMTPDEMRVEEGGLCFLELLEALDISFPAKKRNVLAPRTVMNTKRPGFPSGLCSGISSGGRRIKLISLWERSPHDCWVTGPPAPASLLFSMTCPLSSLPQEPTFPQPCVGYGLDSKDLGGEVGVASVLWMCVCGPWVMSRVYWGAGLWSPCLKTRTGSL